MILSVSRRTDIPAFYVKWFMNRLREGYVLVRNPMNCHLVSRVSLDPKLIDCIVFWTKNPAPLLPHIPEIRKTAPFYCQYTLNAYDKDIELNLPPLERKLKIFCELSDSVGRPDAVVWRYDPILLTEKYSVNWHIESFRHIAQALSGKTHTCIFSFIDIYNKIKNSLRSCNVQKDCTAEEMNTLAAAFADIAAQYDISLRTCTESIDLEKYGIRHSCCIDGALIEKLIGCPIKAKKDPNQRAECGCIESVDIGQYNTCTHGCRYCYANFNPQLVKELSEQHDPNSPLLIGAVDESKDKIKDREVKSLKCKPRGMTQGNLF